MEQQTISFDPETLRKLKLAYKEAVDLELKQFTFQGHELITQYAKYLIEHLENEFTKKGFI